MLKSSKKNRNREKKTEREKQSSKEEEEEENPSMDCCSGGSRWTLSTLVAAFLDLAIAYLLLCCSALSFLAAHFLSIFGLHLPCPHFHTFLLQSPPRAIASVQVSSLTRFPFRRCDVGGEEGGALEEEDCGSVGGGDVVLLRGSEKEVGSDGFLGSGSEEEGLEGRVRRGSGFGSKKMRTGCRRRRRSLEVEKMKSLSITSFSHSRPPQLDWREPNGSPSPQDLVLSRGHHPLLPGDVENSGTDGDCNVLEKIDLQRLDRSEAETIRVLERALEEEQLGRSALYLELEKERSSAATAADEAMAMIERLRKEKAMIEMNAKQYQRMIEEKTTYDEEEMDILKEIIVRLERELYVVRKEVEMLRQMMVSSGETETNMQHVFNEDHEMVGLTGCMCHSSFDLEGDPLEMLQQISESTKKKETTKYGNENMDQISSFAEGTEKLPLDLAEVSCSLLHDGNEGAETFDSRHLELPVNADDNMDFQEKGIVSVDVYASDVRSQITKINHVSNVFKLDKSHEHGFGNKVPLLADGGIEENYNKVEVRFQHDGAVEKNNNDSSHLVPESRTLDVHVINDQILLSREGDGKRKISWMDSDIVNSQDCFLPPNDSYGIRNIETMSDHSSTSWTAGEQNIRRYRSDSASVRSLDGPHSMVDSSFNPSGSSMSLVDSERTKLESEVEGLKERLRIVQQGRQKLNLPVAQRQKENFQLQLLQEIAFQLQEIRQLSNPGKATRRASLPPPSSKGNSKKRRSRSDSWAHHGSN